MARTAITDESVSEFVRLHDRGQSYRSIGEKFGVDWRTVKSHIHNVQVEREQQHWQVVSRQVDGKFLEDHYAMLRHTGLAVLRAVSTQPLFASPDQIAHRLLNSVANYEVSESTLTLLESRGIDLSTIPLTEFPDVFGDPVSERIPLMLRRSLFDHEPPLERLVKEWEDSWDRFQLIRRRLAAETIGLLNQADDQGSLTQEFGIAFAHEVMAQNLLSLPPDYPVFDSFEGGDEMVHFRPGTPNGTSIRVKSAIGEFSVMEVLDGVNAQISLAARMTPLSEAYDQLATVVSKIENYVDRISLKGRPEGRCPSLCPDALTAAYR